MEIRAHDGDSLHRSAARGGGGTEVKWRGNLLDLRLVSSRIVKGSGSATLDKAGLALVRRVQPLPPLTTAR